MPVTYSVHTAESATAVFPALVRLYAVVYAEPPYAEGPEQVAGFANGLPDETRRDGFTLVVAEDGEVLVGAAYGGGCQPAVGGRAPTPSLLTIYGPPTSSR